MTLFLQVTFSFCFLSPHFLTDCLYFPVSAPLFRQGACVIKSLHTENDILYVAGNSDIVVKAHMEYLLKMPQSCNSIK